MVDALPFIERGVMCQQLIGELKHNKKINVILHACGYSFSRGWKFLENNSLYYKPFYIMMKK